jgi:hypothetical protein
MGTWGAGNFQDDNALDWLWSEVQQPLLRKIESAVAGHDESNGHTIMAAVEVLTVLCEQLQANPPKPPEVAAWRDAYLAAWEGYIDALGCKPKFKKERRAVIVNTFDRLLATSRKRHGG